MPVMAEGEPAALYVEARTLPEIIIDGTLSEGEWGAPWFTDHEGNDYFGEVPEFTYYRANDDEYLYIATVVNDPTPLAEGNDDIWLTFRKWSWVINNGCNV